MFNILFASEAALKIFGWGWKTYIADSWNKFDLFLVCMSVLDVLTDLGWIPDGDSGSGLGHLRGREVLCKTGRGAAGGRVGSV